MTLEVANMGLNQNSSCLMCGRHCGSTLFLSVMLSERKSGLEFIHRYVLGKKRRNT